MTVIAQSSIKTSRIRPPAEIGFLSGEETVKKLGRSPEQSAAKRPYFGFLCVPLEQEARQGADHVHGNRGHGYCGQMVAEAAVRSGCRSGNVIDLSGGRAQDDVRHPATITASPDITLLLASRRRSVRL